MSSLPPNTYKIWCLAVVTLPEGETPDQQDPSLCLTGATSIHGPASRSTTWSSSATCL